MHYIKTCLLLFVSKMAVSSTPVLLLTDGWYAIKTLIDKPLAGLVNAGKIIVGLKLCIYGAELVGSQDACSPLEVSHIRCHSKIPCELLYNSGTETKDAL